jgi:curved DNA-binding protein CbpA
MRKRMSGLFDFWKKKPAGGGEAPRASSRGVPTGVDLYALLEVSPNATEEEIRRAYRKVAAKYHPDRNPGNAEVYQRFLDITKAHEILTNATLRAKYDQAFKASAPKPKFQYPSTRFAEEHERRQEGPQAAQNAPESTQAPTGPQDPWDIMFSPSPDKVQPIYTAFPESEEPGEKTPMPYDVWFPRRIPVSMPPRQKILYQLQDRLPLKDIWQFIRNNRGDPRFQASKTIVVGTLAGAGINPAEQDLAELIGASFEEIAAYVEEKGLARAWRNVLNPLGEQAMLALDYLKPEDLPGYFYMEWDPTGKVLELLYTERT